MAASAAGDSHPQIRKGLDSNYIRGYNCTRDTTYRSPRPSRLSPTAQRQAGGPLPESHPTTQNQLPQPPACFNHMREGSPLREGSPRMGEGSSPFVGRWPAKPAGGARCAGPEERIELLVHLGEGSSPFMGRWPAKPAGGARCAGPEERIELLV